MDFNFWKSKAGLDSLEYYKLAYTDSVHYTTFENYSLTQFSVFVAEKGKLIIPAVVYLNNIPVWISAAAGSTPYSISTSDSGMHKLTIRTADREIVLENFYIKPNSRTILAVNKDVGTEHGFSKVRKNVYSKEELAILNRYVLFYRNFLDKDKSFIINDTRILIPDGVYGRIGPVAGQTQVQKLNGYSLSFQHEPGYEYTLENGIIKIQQPSRSIPENILSNPVNNPGLLSQSAVTSAQIEWEKTNETLNIIYNRIENKIKRQKSGKGRLTLKVENPFGSDIPLLSMLISYDQPQSAQIYIGNKRNFYGVNYGFHKLVLLFPGGGYFIKDSLNILSNGINHYKITLPETFEYQESDKILDLYYNRLRFTSISSDEFFQLVKKLGDAPDIKHNLITGKVLDNQGNPVAGASIIVQHARIGSLSDSQGEFEIQVPDTGVFLEVSSIGFETQ